MDTPFDISQKPLSVADLALEREALKGQINAAERRFHHAVVKLASLCGLILTATSVGNAYWGWLPWSDFVGSVGFVGFAGSVAAAVAVSVAVSVAAAAAVAVNVAAGVAAAAAAVASFVTAAACAAVYIWLKQIDRIEQAKAALAALSDADREACLDIKQWLEDDTIRQYRDWVQAECRVFTVGEVKAMRAHWDSRAERQAEAERAAAIDAACREVYVENLTRSELKG
jgi:hypothetical protein